MIDNLLKRLYPIQCGVARDRLDRIDVDIEVAAGSVNLNDSKACDECLRLRPYRKACDKVNLRLDTSGATLEIVDFEGDANQLDNTPASLRERCDYILVDGTSRHDKIAFCDLSCSEEKYVSPNNGAYPLGKRAKAFEQMKRSLERLLQEPMLAQYILTFPNKVCIFGWRDYTSTNAKPQRGNVASNMLAFVNTPSARSGFLSQAVYEVGHGFSFVQVKYPAIYKWR